MKIIELKRAFLIELEDKFPKEEIESFFYLSCEKYLRLSRLNIALTPHLEIDASAYREFTNILRRLKSEEPIQYILGETEFYGLPFQVDNNVLIPRPETEELVAWVLDDIKNGLVKPTSSNIKILDIGTGSGCIAISLAKNIKNAEVWALDISQMALKVTEKNASTNQVNIRFVQADILKESENLWEQLLEIKGGKFDIVISNPPYVRNSEKKQMKNNVLNHEPHLALFVENENPLLFYDKIASFSQKYLNPKGSLYFEINQEFDHETKSLLKDKNFNPIISKKDLFGVNRMMKGELI